MLLFGVFTTDDKASMNQIGNWVANGLDLTTRPLF
jgi:hypothetical protein